MYELKELLKTSVVNVTFTKVDGTERKMVCTLAEEFLPEKKATTIEVDVENVKPKNDNIFIVYDLEKDAWRSFRLDSVISYFV